MLCGHVPIETISTITKGVFAYSGTSDSFICGKKHNIKKWKCHFANYRKSVSSM
jgi:hypothetical protein